MTDQSPFLFSVREIPLPHILQSSTDRFLSAADFDDSFVVPSGRFRDQMPQASSHRPENTDTDASPESPRSTPPESDPTKADPHDLDEETKYSPDTPGDEQCGQRR